MVVSMTGLPVYLRLYYRRCHGDTLFRYRPCQDAEGHAINMGLVDKPHRRTKDRIEHPFRDFNQHYIGRGVGQSA
jgi:hypothetical protein